MTICYPQIITSRLCPRDELEFSNTPPTCVRVVPIYNDAIYVVGQFPPPVHFLITDSGQVYQLADITSPPSTPPEYHALLDPSGCILVGVELSSITNAPITNSQIRVLPGVLRYILTTLGLGIGDVTSQLPVQRCRRQLWQEIVDATVDCLNQPPPPPPTPPSLTCGFVLSCLSNGQNIAISGGGTISAGQLVPGPNAGEYTWLNPLGVPQYTFSLTSGLSVFDTTTVDLTLSPGPVLSANVIVSPATGNQLQILPTGLYVPPAAFNVVDTFSVDLTFTGGNLSADVNISPAPGNQITITPQGLFVPPSTATPCFSTGLAVVAPPLASSYFTVYDVNTGCLNSLIVPADTVPYGDPFGSGIPRFDNLIYNQPNNFLRNIAGPNNVNVVHSALTLTSNSFIPSGILLSGVLSNATINTAAASSYLNLNNVSGNYVNQSCFLAAQATFENIQESTAIIYGGAVYNAARSFIQSNNAIVNFSRSSTVHVDNVQLGDVFQSFAIADGSPLTLQPVIRNSLYIGRSSSSNFSQINFSHSLVDNVSFVQHPINYSQIIANTTTMDGPGFYTRYSSLFAESATIGLIDTSFVIARSTGPQRLNVDNSFLIYRDTTPPSNRIGPASPIINNSFASLRGRAPGMTTTVYATTDQPPISGIDRSVYVANNVTLPDPNPPVNLMSLQQVLMVGRNLRVDLTGGSTIQNLVMVGDNLQAGQQSILVVGSNSVTTPAIQSVGGFQVIVADGSPIDNMLEAWDGLLWRFRVFRETSPYPNDASASANLTAIYGADPRIKFGTLIFTNVAGRPALFAWDGATFVRISV